MDPFLPLLLSLVLPWSELAFEGQPRQLAPGDCGPAVARALLGEGVDPSFALGDIDSAGGALSLSELALRLEGAGLGTRGLALGEEGLGSLLERGLSPLVLHYDGAAGHWVLLHGRAGPCYVLGDPALGLELLAPSDLARRWSGVVLAIDPRTLPASVLGEGRGALSRGRERLSLLARAANLPGLAAGPLVDDRPRPEFSLGLDLRGRGGHPLLSGELGLRLGTERGYLFCGLPFVLGAGSPQPSLVPAALRLGLGALGADPPWYYGLSLGLNDLGELPGPLDSSSPEPGLGLRLDIARLLDPFVLALRSGLSSSLPGFDALALLLGLGATGAMGRSVYLDLSAELTLIWGSEAAPLLAAQRFGLMLGLRLGDLDFSFGSLEAPEGPGLLFEGSWSPGGGGE